MTFLEFVHQHAFFSFCCLCVVCSTLVYLRWRP